MNNQITAFINPEQVKRCLYVCWVANERAREMGLDIKYPVALIGDTGCGKTMSVKDFHKAMSKKCKELGLYTVILSMDEPTDIGGVIVPNMKERKADHLMLRTLPFDTEETCIILADEYDRSTPETQNSFAQVLLPTGTLHGHRISPNAFTVLTLNGTADIYTTPLSKQIRTRVVSLFVSSLASGAEESHKEWAESVGLPPIVSRFWSNNKGKMSPVQVYEEMAELTPRTLDMAGVLSLALKEIEKKGRVKVADIRFPLIAGIIGASAAREFIMLELLDDFRIEDILERPQSVRVIEETSKNLTVLELLVSCMKPGNTTHSKAAAIYAGRQTTEEVKLIWFRRLLAADPLIANTDEYVVWANRRGRG